MNWLTITLRFLVLVVLFGLVGLAVDILVQLFGLPVIRLIAILLLLVTIPGLVFIWKKIPGTYAHAVILLGGLTFIAMLIIIVVYSA